MLMAFKLPALPPSVNKMYKINYRTKEMYKDKSVAEFRRKVWIHIPSIKPPVDRLKITIQYHGKFINKSNGKTKKRD